MKDHQLLVLIVQLGLKDEIVDTLMAMECISGFSLTNICGFSREHSHFNLREQVEGYRDFCKFEIMHAGSCQGSLLTAISTVSRHNPCRYWILPLQACGTLPRNRDTLEAQGDESEAEEDLSSRPLSTENRQ